MLHLWHSGGLRPGVCYAQDLLGIVQVRAALLALFLAFGSGFIGFLDDYIKVVKHRNLGLLAWQKLIMQFIVTGGFLVGLHMQGLLTTIIMLPFIGAVDLGWVYYPIAFFGIIFLVNAVNLTDGLDGLCTSVTILVATFFTIVAIGENSGISPITGAVVGSLLGFLLFNVYPARVFMGDTGSLALGGFVASSAFMMQMPIFIAVVGLIYLVEVLSVILQVTYFKKTGGKRIFKMAPIHHHFELCGFNEYKIVIIFSAVGLIAGIIANLIYDLC